MPWVERDGGGSIVGVYQRRQPGTAEEHLGDDDPEVNRFRSAGAADLQARRELEVIDARSVRAMREAMLLLATVAGVELTTLTTLDEQAARERQKLRR